MKIGVFQNLPLGGAKRTLYEELRVLSKRHIVDLFEVRTKDSEEDFLNPKDLVRKVERFDFKVESTKPHVFGRLVRDYNNFFTLSLLHKKIAEKINNGNYDVALVHADRFAQAPFILKFLKIPSLYFCQEYLRIGYEKELAFNEKVMFLKKWYEELTRKVRVRIDKDNAREATLIVANSRFTKRNVERAFGVKVRVCSLGVDTRTFKPTMKKIKKVLFLGGWEKIDGYDLAKEAAEKAMSNVGFEFKQLIFSTRKTDSDLAKEYSESIVTLCTSYNEPFGLVSLESMACGTPVLAVNEGGYMETVVDGKTGYLVSRNPETFSERIVHFIKHPDIVERMGKAGRERVMKDFTWERHCKCLEERLIEISKVK